VATDGPRCANGIESQFKTAMIVAYKQSSTNYAVRGPPVIEACYNSFTKVQHACGPSTRPSEEDSPKVHRSSLIRPFHLSFGGVAIGDSGCRGVGVSGRCT
jgi:hypothetical protein